MDPVKSYFAKDEFLWQDLSGELARRYVDVFAFAMNEMGYSIREPVHGLAVDVGCGGGRYTQLLSAYFSSVYGIDFTEHFCKAGKVKFGDRITFLCGNVTNLPLVDESASFLLAIGLTEYLSPVQLERFLSEIIRVLEPGGRALIRFWKKRGPMYLISRAGRGVVATYPEFYFQSILQLKRICDSLGFTGPGFLGGLLISRWYGLEWLGGWPQVGRKLVMGLERRLRYHSMLYDTVFMYAQK